MFYEDCLSLEDERSLGFCYSNLAHFAPKLGPLFINLHLDGPLFIQTGTVNYSVIIAAVVGLIHATYLSL